MESEDSTLNSHGVEIGSTSAPTRPLRVLHSQLAMLRLRSAQLISVLRLIPFDSSTEVGRSKERYRLIALNMVTAFVARSSSVAVSFLSVPIVLTYLGKEQYGLWIAITSVTSWLMLFDLGVVSGLVNRLSESYGRDDRKAAVSYVSTSLALLVGMVLSVGLIFVIVAPLVDWSSALAAKSILNSDVVMAAVIAAVVPILVKLPLGCVGQIYAGYQRSYVGNLFLAIGPVTVLVALLAAVHQQVSLPMLILVYGGSGLLVSLASFLYLFGVDMTWLRPRIDSISFDAVKRLLSVSVPLFLFQFGALLVNSSQPIILAHLVDLHTVTDYSIVIRVYAVLVAIILLSTNSFIPPFREAFERGDLAWALSSYRRVQRIRMVLALGTGIALLVGGNWFMSVWLQRSDVHFESSVWAAASVLLVASVWASTYTDILTVMDRIWPQVGLVIVNGVTTVLLTLWLAPRFGVLGAVLAVSAMTVVVLSWLLPRLMRPILLSLQKE